MSGEKYDLVAMLFSLIVTALLLALVAVGIRAVAAERLQDLKKEQRLCTC